MADAWWTADALQKCARLSRSAERLRRQIAVYMQKKSIYLSSVVIH